MADRVGGDRIVPATVRTAGGEPVMGPQALSGHVDVQFDAIGVGAHKPTTTQTGMTTDHPCFGGPKAAATEPRWTP